MTNLAAPQQHSTKSPARGWPDSSAELGIWHDVCVSGDLKPYLGVRALLGERQVALFRTGDGLYAIDAIDPFSKAAVLSRGIVGDLRDQTVVASPLYKHHFNLETGVCLEDETLTLRTYPIKEEDGLIRVFA